MVITMSDQALVIIEQRDVDFYGDELTAVRAEDGHINVSLAHLCDALGIDTQGQARRIKRQSILLKGYSWVDILSTSDAQTNRAIRIR
jgi:hypothetical protein